MINWTRLFDQYRVEWQHGSGNNIEIHCPWCGSADEGKHLSVSLSGDGFKCWRRPLQHFGRNPVRILTAVLKISITEARTIAGIKHDLGDDNNLGAFVRSALNRTDTIVQSIKTLSFPQEYKPISSSGAARGVYAYVEDRGFPRTEADQLIKHYDLRTTLSGTFRYRVVIPVYMPHMGLVNWTARHITESKILRYVTLTTDVEKAKSNGDPPAAMNIKHTLLNYDKIEDDYGRDLVICEGPFDALKIDHYGRDAGVRATCTFGKGTSDQQIALLTKIRDRYRNLHLCLDQDARMDALAELGRLAHLGVRALDLPGGVEDPGDLTKEQVRSWI